MRKTVIAIAAHPDDEALGAAGTLARHVAARDDVHILFLADGVSARGSNKGLDARQESAQAAAKAMGAKAENVHFYSFPDNRMDSVALLDVVQVLEGVLKKIKPQIIYTHHAGDLNIDHRIVHQAVLTACRPQPGSAVEAIYGFEVLSSTEWVAPEPDARNVFLPNRYVDITDYMETKMAALKCYDIEMRDFPHARSYEAVEALAKLRGAHMGLERAEAFSVIREIFK
jgi:LmbE family N-acetylglucosaminyl deacetylase